MLFLVLVNFVQVLAPEGSSPSTHVCVLPPLLSFCLLDFSRSSQQIAREEGLGRGWSKVWFRGRWMGDAIWVPLATYQAKGAGKAVLRESLHQYHLGPSHTPFHDKRCIGLDFTRFPSRSPPKPSFSRISGSIKFPLTRALQESWSHSLAFSSHYVGKLCSRLPRDVGAAVLRCYFAAVHAAFSC